MSSRAATREYSHFLVKYDDSILYTCPRVKILTDGRVRIGSQYPVIYGNSIVSPAILSSSRQIPTPLFNDIPESVRLSDDDLSKLVHSTTTAGGLAVCLLRHLYPELFTEDQLRVYFSYRGGGKLSKTPLDDTRKHYIRRYVTAFYPQVSTESAYHALVVEKINQYLRRPVQQKK